MITDSRFFVLLVIILLSLPVLFTLDTVIIDTKATDTIGNSLATPFYLGFTTEVEEVPVIIIPDDDDDDDMAAGLSIGLAVVFVILLIVIGAIPFFMFKGGKEGLKDAWDDTDEEDDEEKEVDEE